ncbi:hypothetical protein H9P43_000298 [Blastocladiella emersonii ATCC 22665]|nr:hypothetical protein H9P43_000298 [Blastocladiella emersonii ATCC 22665]
MKLVQRGIRALTVSPARHLRTKAKANPMTSTPSASPSPRALPHPAPAWYSRAFPHFPAFSGPFAVGVVDFEWDGAFPASHADLVSPATSALVRIFYPAAVTPADAEARIDWLAAHEGAGYGDFLGLPRFVSRPAFGSIFAHAKVPAIADALPAPAAPAADDHPALPHDLPVAVFSHGLGGCKGTYQYFCGDLASRGAVVLAVEHRDRSACISVERSAAAPPKKHREHVYRRVPVTVPVAEENVQIRRDQVRHRVAEVRKAVAFARRLARGELPPAAHVDAPALAALKGLQGRLDLNRMAMAGHSFGGATAIATLQAQHAERQTTRAAPADADSPAFDFKCGFVMDPWMLPVDPTKPVSVATLISSSETFHWRANMAALSQWIRTSHAASPAGDRTLAFPHVTLRGTAHQNHSDFPLLLPGLLRRVRMAGPADPRVALLRNNALAVEFMHRHGVDVAAPHYSRDLLELDAVAVGGTGSTTPLTGETASVLASTLDMEHPDYIHGWDVYVEKHGIEDPSRPAATAAAPVVPEPPSPGSAARAGAAVAAS